MKNECACGENCDICEGCGHPYCECECTDELKLRDDEDQDDADTEQDDDLSFDDEEDW